MSDEKRENDREDPFGSLEVPEDREGDPFERLGDAGPSEDDSVPEIPAEDDATADDPAFEEEFIDEDDPFAGMDNREGDPFGDGESVFEAVDVESIDTDEVWGSLDEEPSTPSVQGSRYVDVSKHRFCEQCEHFSAPPNAHCTHEEAEIIEYLDMETVRLLNCPVVAEQRELEDEG
ncbi:hypothetical protein BRC96_06400 [Halobacteriales archaeon QS_6_64_34]|nr:MAG: hypothetical protein BRC96_06400 [Halobacteriales archaeon QS_6_64_34]